MDGGSGASRRRTTAPAGRNGSKRWQGAVAAASGAGAAASAVSDVGSRAGETTATPARR
ncbi:hypothetical protein Syun_030416 [Stephania yunnanensis]|uniref:Uncharacterized protein n=1 Tax=Stephania yunnanensis TaxID=152371 RepID=A0AAP0EBX9_9MAGN